MFSTQCLRSLSRASTSTLSKSITAPLRRSIPQLPTSSRRGFSILTPKRPTLSISLQTPSSTLPTSIAGDLDLLPKISQHPALAGIQVRNGPRDTFNPSHRVRKRRHGFLARSKGGRKGHALLKRRRRKGRMTLSH